MLQNSIFEVCKCFNIFYTIFTQVSDKIENFEFPRNVQCLLSASLKSTVLVAFCLLALVFSSPEPKARVNYCHSAPSILRKLFTFSTSSPEPLDGVLCVVVFQPDPPRGGSREGPK